MSDQLSLTSSPPLAPPRTVKVWTPRTIGVLTFFLGFPGGITLAAINWTRMGLVGKAIGVAFAALAATGLFVSVTLLLPGELSRLPALALNLGFLTYLVSQTKKDIEGLRASEHLVQNAHGAIALLIALAALALWFVLVLILAAIFGIILTLFGVPIPE